MEKIFHEVSQTLSALENSFSRIDLLGINKIPFEGSWTAGQLIQHMILANGGMIDVINGPVTETNRPADLKVGQIKEIFLNFEVKFSSPEFIDPPEKEYDKMQQLDELKRIKAGLCKSIETLDLTRTCSSFELPGMGSLTRLEALYFVTYHSQRHTKQLDNIYDKLG